MRSASQLCFQGHPQFFTHVMEYALEIRACDVEEFFEEDPVLRGLPFAEATDLPSFNSSAFAHVSSKKQLVCCEGPCAVIHDRVRALCVACSNSGIMVSWGTEEQHHNHSPYPFGESRHIYMTSVISVCDMVFPCSFNVKVVNAGTSDKQVVEVRCGHSSRAGGNRVVSLALEAALRSLVSSPDLPMDRAVETVADTLKRWYCLGLPASCDVKKMPEDDVTTAFDGLLSPFRAVGGKASQIPVETVFMLLDMLLTSPHIRAAFAKNAEAMDVFKAVLQDVFGRHPCFMTVFCAAFITLQGVWKECVEGVCATMPKARDCASQARDQAMYGPERDVLFALLSQCG